MANDAILSSTKSKEEEEEEDILVVLDSMDAYINLFDSLTSTLRKGWLDLASARHSMGSSRISSSLLDLKVQPAATTVQVSQLIEESRSDIHYTLSKWGYSRGSGEDVEELQNSSTSTLRHRGSSHLPEGSQETLQATANGGPPTAVDQNIRKERAKCLAVFGTLVPPKLRSAQISFETALETIVEIANMRSSMLSAFSRLKKEQMDQVLVRDIQDLDLGSES